MKHHWLRQRKFVQYPTFVPQLSIAKLSLESWSNRQSKRLLKEQGEIALREYPMKFVLNGNPVEITTKPNSTLLDVLRKMLNVTSVKKGCGRGECGACTVLVDGKAVCSCLTLAPQANNRSVTTVEGLGSKTEIHLLQEAFMKHAAIQCGYCTSGMLLSAKALLDNQPNPTEAEIRTAISGNLCRCTGYAAIIASIQDAASRVSGGLGERR